MKRGKVISIITTLFLSIFIVSGCSGEKEEDNSIELTYNTSELVGKDYEEVVEKLKNSGFTNIKTEKIEDLITGWLTKDGEVEQVKIGDSSEFSQGDKFQKDISVKVSYHTFETKTSSEQVTPSSEEVELTLSVQTEVLDDKVIISGTTIPNAKVSIGKGIIGDSTEADEDGKFVLEEEITSPNETTLEINAKLNGQKKSVDVTFLPTENFIEKYEAEQAAEAERKAKEKEERAAKEAKQKTSEEEANKIITQENTPEFEAILTSYDDYESYKEFADKYEGRIIEFDGNIAYMSLHKNKDSRFDFLIYYGDYSEDGSGTSGPNFQFKDKAISDTSLKLVDKYATNKIIEGQNLHIKAKIKNYNYDQGLFFLEPVEVVIR